MGAYIGFCQALAMRTHGTGGPRLHPDEMASAATMGSVCAGLVVVGSLLPSLGGLQLIAVVPFGVSAQRHGLRALLAALVASALLAFLIAGPGAVVTMAGLATIGGVVGLIKRRGGGVGSAFMVALVLAPLAAGAFDLLLYIFSSYRRLALQNVRAQARGIGKLLYHVLPGAAHVLEEAAAVVTAHWAVFAAGAAVLVTVVVLALSWVLIGAVLERLSWVSAGRALPHDDARTSAAAGGSGASGGSTSAPAPLPVTLVRASCRYGGVQALADVDLSLELGELAAVVGANGSGKSTLARLLAGQRPSAGSVRRAG